MKGCFFMKPAMKKCLTAVLAATVSVSVFSVPANAAEPAAHVLSIDIDSDHIVTHTGKSGNIYATHT